MGRSMNHARLFLVLLSLTIALGACASMGDSADQAYGWLSESRPDATTTLALQIGESAVPAVVFYPKGYSKTRRFPALLLLGADSATLTTSLRMAARTRGYVLAIPEAAALSTPEKSLAILDALMDVLVVEHAVDPARLLLVGRGNGADLIGTLTCKRSHRVGGIALFQGGAPLADCRPVKPIPAIIFSNTEGQDSSAQAASFWAHSNGCSPLPQKIRRQDYSRERYECTLPNSAVQRYILDTPGVELGGAPSSGQSSFSAAWTVVDFFTREAGN
jgi:poly(3-hydroxybutyrate) depolymerase